MRTRRAAHPAACRRRKRRFDASARAGSRRIEPRRAACRPSSSGWSFDAPATRQRRRRVSPGAGIRHCRADTGCSGTPATRACIPPEPCRGRGRGRPVPERGRGISRRCGGCPPTPPPLPGSPAPAHPVPGAACRPGGPSRLAPSLPPVRRAALSDDAFTLPASSLRANPAFLRSLPAPPVAASPAAPPGTPRRCRSRSPGASHGCEGRREAARRATDDGRGHHPRQREGGREHQRGGVRAVRRRAGVGRWRASVEGGDVETLDSEAARRGSGRRWRLHRAPGFGSRYDSGPEKDGRMSGSGSGTARVRGRMGAGRRRSGAGRARERRGV